jgi:hypothetical protein
MLTLRMRSREAKLRELGGESAAAGTGAATGASGPPTAPRSPAGHLAAARKVEQHVHRPEEVMAGGGEARLLRAEARREAGARRHRGARHG